jgi:EmrB/QacA subfamily drug resistance transporter
MDGVTPHQRHALGVLSVASFMVFLDATIVNIAFPSIEHSFPAASRAELSWVLGAYNIVFAALIVPAGRMADVVGRRRLFLGGLLSFSAASAVCAAARNPAVLIAARVVQAAGGAALVPSGLALLLAALPLSRRARAVSLLGGATAVAAVLGPTVGGLLVEAADWRWVFVINVPIGLAAWLAARSTFTKATVRQTGSLPDLVGIGLAIAGMGLLALGLVQAREWGWSDPRIVGSLAAAFVLIPAFLLRSHRHRAPVVELQLFQVRSFAVANLGMFILAVAFYGLLLGNVLFLTTVWHDSILKAALTLTATSLAAVPSTVVASRLADRHGPRVLVVPAALLYAAGAGWYALRVGTTPAFAREWLPGAMLTGIGIGAAFPTLAGVSAASLTPSRFAVGSAVNTMARQTGAVLGVALVVTILGPTRQSGTYAAFQLAWVFGASMAMASAIVCMALHSRRVSAPADLVRGPGRVLSPQVVNEDTL